MGKRLLIDSNIIIYYLKGTIPKKNKRKLSVIFRESLNISTLTKIEVFGFHRIVHKDIIKAEILLKKANIYYVDSNVESKAIAPRQKNSIKLADAIIAATALLNRMSLVTRNEKDFRKVSHLKIYNPFKQ
jgi:predicted nucleic acid-binding protein